MRVSTLLYCNDTATTEIYALSLHDALPISHPESPPARCGCGRSGPALGREGRSRRSRRRPRRTLCPRSGCCGASGRSEEHTSELQSRQYLVCRLLLEKKKSNLTKLSPHYPY